MESGSGEQNEFYTKKLHSSGKKWTERRRDDAESRRDHSVDERGVFGGDLLSAASIREFKLPLVAYGNPKGKEDRKRIKELARKDEDRRAERYADQLFHTEGQLITLAKNRPTLVRRFIYEFLQQNDTGKFTEMMSEEDLRESRYNRLLLQAIFPQSNQSSENAKSDENHSIAKTLTEKMAKHEFMFTDKELLDAIKIYQQKFSENQKKMIPELQNYRKKVSGILIKACNEGKIPLSPRLVRERLATLDFRVVDGLVASLESIGGNFMQEPHSIGIAHDIPLAGRWKVFVHEVFHALSGQIEKSTKEVDNEEDSDYYEKERTQITKVGLSFSDIDKYNIRRNRGERRPVAQHFRWLNEAITETLTGELIGEKRSYETERELFEMLVTSGIDRKEFYTAYFENYNSRAVKGEHRLPMTKKLFGLTNQKFGQGFLMHLDDYIRKHNVKRTLEKWKELGDDFPKFIQQLNAKSNFNAEVI